jgi:hypothetical protein
MSDAIGPMVEITLSNGTVIDASRIAKAEILQTILPACI